jgi:hypothetical protein
MLEDKEGSLIASTQADTNLEGKPFQWNYHFDRSVPDYMRNPQVTVLLDHQDNNSHPYIYQLVQLSRTHHNRNQMGKDHSLILQH